MKTDEEILEEIATTRNYAKHTRKTYNTVIRNYAKFQGQSIHELIMEAVEEEEERIRWKHRKLRTRLTNYRQYLLDNYLISTVRGNLMRIKSVYRFYDIEVLDLPYVSFKNANLPVPLTYNDIPTKEILDKAIQLSSPLLKAIILFISSSGTARAEALGLKISDFVESVQEYTYETDIYKVIYELQQRNDIIPMFKLKRQKTNQYYYTFCSPEATRAICDYLLTRKHALTSDMPLFKISTKYLSTLLGQINDQLGLGKRGGFNVIRCHMLRKYHASQLAEAGISTDHINLLQGRKIPGIAHETYIRIKPETLREEYIKALPHIVISDEDRVKTELETITEQKTELETRFDTMQEQLDKIQQSISWEDAMKEY